MKEKKERRDRQEFYDSGCMLLIEAVVRRAAEDYFAACSRMPDRRAAARIREVSAFFRSEYFSRLTGVQGESLLQKIRKEAEKK